MYENLKGKKLLVIGSEETDASIVRAAKQLGIYTIAVDGKPKSNSTIAKSVADEAWDIDYRKTEQLGEMCLESGVDGVMAGYSEFRVLAACRVAKYIGSPFYATEEQIELTRNKRAFKDECKKYGINTPKDFCYNSAPTAEQISHISYPVIVKPTDYAGRKGITICYSEKQMPKAIEYAMSCSQSKTIIVEQYVSGTEFSAVYSIKEGKCSLSFFAEKYLNQECSDTGLCDLSLTPSKYLDGYLESSDEPVKAFLKGINAQNGVAFFQGIVNDTGYYIFEMGYRLNGGNDYVSVDNQNGINYMKMLISHSLTGDMADDLRKDNPRFRKFFSNFILYAHAGEIEEISYNGENERKGIEDIHIYKRPGMIIPEDGSTGQRVFSFKLSGDSLSEIVDTINYIQDHVVVKNLEHQNMLFNRFDTNRLIERN